MLSTIELMIPRFKVISDFPGNFIPVGSIITDESMADYYRKYPSNFEELSWYDDRDKEDYPPYLKMDARFLIKSSELTKTYQPWEDAPFEYQYGSYHISCFQFATEEEWNHYNTLTKKEKDELRYA